MCDNRGPAPSLGKIRAMLRQLPNATQIEILEVFTVYIKTEYEEGKTPAEARKAAREYAEAKGWEVPAYCLPDAAAPTA